MTSKRELGKRILELRIKELEANIDLLKMDTENVKLRIKDNRLHIRGQKNVMKMDKIMNKQIRDVVKMEKKLEEKYGKPKLDNKMVT